MTPREIQLTMKAASEARLDRYDEGVVAAWQGALWGRTDKKHFPKLKDVLARRRRRKKKLTLEQDIARFESFFRRNAPRVRTH